MNDTTRAQKLAKVLKNDSDLSRETIKKQLVAVRKEERKALLEIVRDNRAIWCACRFELKEGVRCRTCQVTRAIDRDIEKRKTRKEKTS